MTTYRLYRGEHGSCPDLSTRHGALTFCDDWEVCHVYATDPNHPEDTPVNPRIITADVVLTNPFITQLQDPFIDVALFIDAFGVDYARQVAMKFEGEIRYTNNWEENILPQLGAGQDYSGFIQSEDNLRQLYFQAWPYFDDKEETAFLQRQGYDGAIMAGSAQSMDAIEYRVFSPSQVTIVAVTPVKDGDNENKVPAVDNGVCSGMGVA